MHIGPVSKSNDYVGKITLRLSAVAQYKPRVDCRCGDADC